MSAGEEITAHKKLECARRELKLRRKHYPKWVSMGTMRQEQADRELRLMEAIVHDYEVQAKECLPL
jgi:hypothetical protein